MSERPCPSREGNGDRLFQWRETPGKIPRVFQKKERKGKSSDLQAGVKTQQSQKAEVYYLEISRLNFFQKGRDQIVFLTGAGNGFISL